MNRGLWLWLLAGPNGSGKSTYATYAPNLSSLVEEIVRPDELASELSPAAPDTVAVKAARLAIGRIRSLLEKRRSFAVETTLSGHFHLEIAERARSEGWKVGVVYIGLRSPELAIERVRLRRLQGGHNVPPADVRRRYARSLENLASLYQTADRLVVLDNSSSASSARPKPMTLVLEAHQGRIVFRQRSLPRWLRGKLGPILKVRSTN
jgi:predicted ABC-type ATPase